MSAQETYINKLSGIIAEITKDVAQVYRITIGLPHKWVTWSTIIIREWPGGGSIDIQGDYGNYSYSWGSIGEQTFREFLRGLNYDYFMNKASSNRGSVFSLKETLKAWKELIIEYRKCGSLDKETAKDCWENIKDLTELWGIASDNEAELMRFVESETPELLRELFHNDWSGIIINYVRCPLASEFWLDIWPIACAEWKKEERKS